MKREDVVLFGIGSILQDRDLIDRDLLGNSLGISARSLSNILSKLVKNDMIRSTGSEYGSLSSIQLTKNGEKEFLAIKEDLIKKRSKNVFDEGVTIDISKMIVSPGDPYDIIGIVDNVVFRKTSSIEKVIERITSHIRDRKFSRYFEEIIGTTFHTSTFELEHVLKRSSIYGIPSIRRNRDKEVSAEDIRSMIFDAERARREGDIEKAKGIYGSVLSNVVVLDMNVWVLCFTGLIQCLVYENKEVRSVELLDEVMEVVETPVHKSLLRKLKADIIQDLGRMDEASRLYHSCLAVLSERENPILRITVLNNLGVLYLRKDDRRSATALWKDALRIARKENLPWMISIASINLADVYSMNGRIETAVRSLRNARKILEQCGDMEGLSAVDFNMALVQIAKGNEKMAYRYFERSKSFGLLYLRKSEERERVFKERIRNIEK